MVVCHCCLKTWVEYLKQRRTLQQTPDYRRFLENNFLGGLPRVKVSVLEPSLGEYRPLQVASADWASRSDWMSWVPVSDRLEV